MKKFLSVLLVVLCFVMVAPTAFASGISVEDNADLFTPEQEESLLSQISFIEENYGIEVIIHTTMSIGYQSIDEYAEGYYYSHVFTVTDNGIVFVINLNNNEIGNRDFYTFYGAVIGETFGSEAFNSENGYINGEILPYLQMEDYFSATEVYLSLVEDFSDGTIDYTQYTPKKNYVFREIVVIALGVGVALLVVFILKGKMTTAVVKKEASDYVEKGSMNVTKSFDVFAYRNVIRTPIPKANSTSGRVGGGSSGGAGGGGGKF